VSKKLLDTPFFGVDTLLKLEKIVNNYFCRKCYKFRKKCIFAKIGKIGENLDERRGLKRAIEGRKPDAIKG